MRPALRPLLATGARLGAVARLPISRTPACLYRRTYATDAEEDLINEDKWERKKRLKSYTIRERLRRRVWGDDPLEPAQYEKMYNKEKELTLRPVVDDPTYIEATDGRGLPIIGVQGPPGLWNVETFQAETPVRDTEDVHRVVHRALVETLTLQLNGRVPEDMFAFDTPRGAEVATQSVAIDVSPEGEVTLKYGAGAEAEILSALEPKILREAVDESESSDSESDNEAPAAAEATEAEPVEAEIAETAEVEVGEPTQEQPQFLVQSLAGEGWVNTPLATRELKFTLTKRIMHLSGRKVSDAVTSQAKTVNDLIKSLVIPPKPKKLAEVLQKSTLASLPNVKLVATKLRPLDKEKAIGRAMLFPELTDHKYHGVDELKDERPFSTAVSQNWFKKAYKL